MSLGRTHVLFRFAHVCPAVHREAMNGQQKLKGPRLYRRPQKLPANDCPRYMNVPCPCCVAAAGVGKQSVWGLRIIADLNYYFALVL